MRYVLVFGTSGCGKKDFLDTLRDEDHHRFSVQIECRKLEHPLRVLRLRSEIVNQIRQIKARFQPRPGTCFVGLHATHLHEAFVYSAIPLSVLRELKTAFCITLLDDLYAMQARLGSEGYRYSYRDLVLWLRAELLMADLIAEEVVTNRTVQTKNFILGAKHPRSVVSRLVGPDTTPKVYAAYSITGVLSQQNTSVRKKLLKENIEYRRKLVTLGAVVFDPATLDDRILINKIIQDRNPRRGRVRISRSKRWPYTIGRGLNAPTLSDPPNAFPIEIPHVEAFVLKITPQQTPHRPYSDIDALITQIDLRYVSQADFITVWRPFCLGTYSSGCFREARTAAELGKSAVAFCPREDREMLGVQSRPLSDKWPSGVPLIEKGEGLLVPSAKDF